MDELGKAEEKRRRRRIWLLVLAPIAAIIVVAGAVAAIWFATGRAELNEAIAELKAAGIPTSLDEMIPPPVPDAENAAVVYEKAWTELGGVPEEISDIHKALVRDPPHAWPTDKRRRLSECLEEKQAAVDLTKRATRFDRCRFDVNYEDGLGMRLPHLAHMVSLAKLMRLDALAETSNGNFESAVESARTGMRLSRHCNTDASMLSRLVDIACHAIAADGLAYALTYGSPSLAQLGHLLSNLEGEAPDTHMTRAITAEMCLGRDIYDRRRKGYPVSGPRSKEAQDIASLLLQLIADRDEAFYLRVMLRYAKLADKPCFQVGTEAEALDAEVEEADWVLSIVRVITPRCGEAIKAASRQEAGHEVLRLAVALMIYEKERGVFPDTLDALAPDIIPEMPIDPFSGKPYVYRRDDGGFVVYSLGRNMRDDNGVPRQAGSDKGDIVFRYSRSD